ncbi:MAG: imidazolonepropionase [Actinobacteria bacterium]|nr:imidazolonepropionase [Actinomycetota bacterium]
MSVSLDGALQVLLPPGPGEPFLRLDRAAEATVDPGSVAVRDGVIAALAADDSAAVRVDCAGAAVVPGFVDCHTHLPFAGWRAVEYEQKVTGVSYEEITRSGGGIASSARALAESSDEDLLSRSRALRAEMLRSGTTTFEAKTGYGLSRAVEERLVRLGRELGADRVTGLFAHVVPPGYDAAAWMDEVEILARETDVDALDIFVESMAFGNADLERLGALAAEVGVPLRAHVEQFNANGSVPVALDLGARSVDHLACLTPADLPRLARSECGAVLLPGAELLGDEEVAPGRALADAGAIGVLATDFNPGTSPVQSLPLIIGIAVRRYGWTAREALIAATLNAAHVLDLAAERGSIEVGKRADLVVLDGPIEHVAYRFGHNPVAAVVEGGELVWVRPDQEWRVTR